MTGFLKQMEFKLASSALMCLTNLMDMQAQLVKNSWQGAGAHDRCVYELGQ